jgi:Skp family chaperone for outer membrane proteins
MSKRVLALSTVLLLTSICSVPAQLSLGPVGYVDSEAVLETYWAESEGTRRYNAAYQEFLIAATQAQAELDSLRAQRADARDRGDARRIDAISDQIADLELYLFDLQERWELRSDELLSELPQDDFQFLLLQVIQYVAESRGFLSVVDLANNPSVLYHSREVDLTDAVIEELRNRQR